MSRRGLIMFLSIAAIIGAIVFRITQSTKEKNAKENEATSATCFKLTGSRIDGYYYNLCGKDVVIPSNVAGVEITVIGESAFENLQITSVTLPETLIKIEQFAFNKNNIEKVVFPEKVTYIGKNAFSNNKLTSIEFKSKKVEFGETPFNNNQLDDKNAFIYDMTYGDNTHIVSYAGKNRENVVIPKGVTDIGAYSFSDLEIKKLTLNKELSTIGNGAFVGNLFEEITIPDSVVYFGDNLLNYDIKRVNVENKNNKEDFGYYGMQTFPDNVLKFKGKTKKSEKELQLEEELKLKEGIK